jgi:hypothetical protein
MSARRPVSDPATKPALPWSSAVAPLACSTRIDRASPHL